MFELINKVKEINPLVLHYTNEVTINGKYNPCFRSESTYELF